MTQAPPPTRAADDEDPDRPHRSQHRLPEDGSAGALLLDFLCEQRARLEQHRPGAGRGEPEAIHSVRVAARRARSVLATYAVLLDRDAGDDLSGELRWLGSALGAARDAEVVRRQLEGLLADQPESAARERVAGQIEAGLGDRAASGISGVREALDSDRCQRLLEAYDTILAAPPLTSRADEPAEAAVPVLLAEDWRRLRARARRAAHVPGGQRDEPLHEVRKAAKRLRYAAQSAIPVLGEPAEQLAATAAEVQGALGEHRDSRAAGEILDGLGHSSVDEQDRKLLHHLRERQRRDAARLEDEYGTAYRLLRRAQKRLRTAFS